MALLKDVHEVHLVNLGYNSMMKWLQTTDEMPRVTKRELLPTNDNWFLQNEAFSKRRL